MKKASKPDPLAERPNLDFSKGVRGKYSNLLTKGTNVVTLDPVLLRHFPDSASVNRALHAFLDMRDTFHSAAPRRQPKSTASVMSDRRTRTLAKTAAAR